MTIIKDFEKLIWLLVIICIVCLICLLIIKAIKNKYFNDLSTGKKKSNKINTTLKGSGLIKTASGKGFIFGKLNKKEVVLNNFFITITNANFDDDAILKSRHSRNDICHTERRRY